MLSTDYFFMTDDKKLSVADLEERLLYDDDDDAASGIDVRQLLTILILHWRWFVLSVVLCLAGAFAYLRYTTAIMATAFMVATGVMPTRTTEIITIKV